MQNIKRRMKIMAATGWRFGLLLVLLVFLSAAFIGPVARATDNNKDTVVNFSTAEKDIKVKAAPTDILPKIIKTSFFTTIQGEAVLNFHNPSGQLWVAPGVALLAGYQGKDFTFQGGFLYFFHDFYGGRDLLAQFGGQYKLRAHMGGDIFFSWGIGASLARNFYSKYVNDRNQLAFFLLPETSFDFFFGKFSLSLFSRVYVPLRLDPYISYGFGVQAGLGF